MRRRSQALLLAAAVACSGWTGLPAANAAGATRGVNSAEELSGRRVNSVPTPDARVDINHATVDELLKVPGMTRIWAARIVRFRPYRSKQDLLDRGIVTSAVYDRIRDCIIAHRNKQ